MQAQPYKRIGIVGGGAFGTALATVGRRSGLDVVLYAREPSVVDAINSRHENVEFLPGASLDPAIRATSDPLEAINADAVFITTPAQYVRAALEPIASRWDKRTPAIVCAKGIEQSTAKLMTEVVTDVMPDAKIGVLSGPSFAAEVARDLPTAVTFACADGNVRQQLPGRFGTPHFRIYSTTDIVGAQIGGAVKNVLAIACGIVTGRGLGDGARAALITRGLAEMTRLAMAKGAMAETLMGLSGMGDLVLTCNAMQSRNFSLGVALGEGDKLEIILSGRTSVAEGVFSAATVAKLGRGHGIDMPICSAVDAILNRGEDVGSTITGLLARPFRAETLTH